MSVSRKACTKCQVEKPLKDFMPNKHKKDGLEGSCKPCRYAARRSLPRTCENCSVKFMAAPGEVNRNRGRYCSRVCWEKHVVSTGRKKEEKSQSWIGDNVGYGGVHAWVKQRLGKPSLCDFCGTTDAKVFDWSNISGEYKRDLSDWQRLCRKCHMKYDQHRLKGVATTLERYGTLNPRLTKRAVLDNKP